MKLENMFEMSYCINLDERKDRWELAQKEFEKINFFPDRFSAIKADNPAFGCRRSHLTILKEAYEKNANVLIFEDDIEFIHLEDNIIEKALEELSLLPWWDMFYLGGNILRPFYQITPRLAKLSHCQSTHAYGVNKKFLPSLISFLENKEHIIDVLYADGVVPYNNCFITIPMVAIQRTDFSNIENRDMDYSIPLMRYDHFLVKRRI